MVLSCKYVDDVVIEAPFIITEDLIKSLNISEVVNVKTDEDSISQQYQDIDPFAVAKNLGVYCEIEMDKDELTVEKIAQRVYSNKEELEIKFAKKS